MRIIKSQKIDWNNYELEDTLRKNKDKKSFPPPEPEIDENFYYWIMEALTKPGVDFDKRFDVISRAIENPKFALTKNPKMKWYVLDYIRRTEQERISMELPYAEGKIKENLIDIKTRILPFFESKIKQLKQEALQHTVN